MSFDFSTLVTDRIQSDVDQRNAKGTYNAADLNRVTAAMEALDEMFRAYGYHSGYTPIFMASRGGQGGQLPEFVPFTDASGAAGFYDRVGHGFYTSAGLTAGPAAPPEPEPEPGPVLDPYTWYESDIPMQSQMAQYLANLAALRGVLSQVAAEPPTPESMALLTYVEANDIETILLQIEAVLTTIGAGFLRAGMPWAVAGGPEIFARNGGTA